MLLVLSFSAVAVVDDLQSVQVYIKGNTTVFDGTAWENGTRVYNVPITAECSGTSLGMQETYSTTFFKQVPGILCTIGTSAKVCAGEYCEATTVTKKRIHIGKTEKKVVPPAEVIIPGPVIIPEPTRDVLQECLNNATTFKDDNLRDCHKVSHREERRCEAQNAFTIIQYFGMKHECYRVYD